MRRGKIWIGDLLPLLAVCALIVYLVVPQSSRVLTIPAFGHNPVQSAAGEQKRMDTIATGSTRQIAALFGWRERGASATSKSPPPQPPTAEEAPWINHVGHVVGERGVPVYIFKDTRSGSVLSLAPNVENRGWKLVDIRAGDFLLEIAGKQYVVRKSE